MRHKCLFSCRLLDVPPPTQNGYHQPHQGQPHSPGHQVRKMGVISPSSRQHSPPMVTAAAAAAAAASATSVLSSMAAVQLKAANLRVREGLPSKIKMSLSDLQKTQQVKSAFSFYAMQVVIPGSNGQLPPDGNLIYTTPFNDNGVGVQPHQQQHQGFSNDGDLGGSLNSSIQHPHWNTAGQPSNGIAHA